MLIIKQLTKNKMEQMNNGFEIIGKENIPSNGHAVNWVNEMKDMCKPDKIQWLNGSEEEEKEWVKEDVQARKTAIGYIPNAKDIHLEGINLTEEDVEELLHIDKEAWTEEVQKQEEFFRKFGNKLPEEIIKEHKKLKARIAS